VLCSDPRCDNKDHDGLCRNNENYNWERVEGDILYCPKIFIKIGMEMKEIYFQKRPERLKAFH
jgi:hypothetical protein